MPDRYGENHENDGYPQDDSRACGVADCHLCDDNGLRDGFLCSHIDHAAASKRGMDMIREAMGWPQE